MCNVKCNCITQGLSLYLNSYEQVFGAYSICIIYRLTIWWNLASKSRRMVTLFVWLLWRWRSWWRIPWLVPYRLSVMWGHLLSALRVVLAHRERPHCRTRRKCLRCVQQCLQRVAHSCSQFFWIPIFDGEHGTTFFYSFTESDYSVQNLLSSSLLSKKLKIKIYRTIILPIILYGC